MSARGALVILFGMLAALAVGVAAIWQLRVRQGDVFPEYSTFRADPLGTRALFESLAALPGFAVDRGLKPLEKLPAAPRRTLILAGFDRSQWARWPKTEFDAVDGAVRAGSRLVIAFRADFASGAAPAAEAKPEGKDSGKEPPDPDRDADSPATVDAAEQWGVEVAARRPSGSKAAPERAVPAAADLPVTEPWRSELAFQIRKDAPWQVAYRRGAEAVVVERALGLGSIVLAGDSYFLSNEALQRDPEPDLLAWTVGPNDRVLFDESHLGVVAETGVAALGRRYGLIWAAITLALLAVLFAWRQAALFAPQPDEEAVLSLRYRRTAGLERLLHRSVPPAQLAAVCRAEWEAGARREDRARAATAAAALSPNAPAAAAYNAIARALRRR